LSAENVELIRSLQPAPEVDLVALFTDDAAFGQLAEVLRDLLDPAFECAIHLFPGATPTLYRGPDALRACWLDWLAPWASYRTEIEELIDAGESVVVFVRDYGRRELGAPEVEMMGAAVYTVQGGRIVRVDFNADRAEALASVGLAEKRG
jgi:ketosteroid isomerase-like protein